MPETLLRTLGFTLGAAVLAAVALLAGARVLHAADAATLAVSTAALQSDDEPRPAGWTDESHSNDVAPNYDVVFPIDAVNTLTITIAPDDWAAMQTDMAEINAASRWIRDALIEAGPDLTLDEREALVQELWAARLAEQNAATTSPTATAHLTDTVDAPVSRGVEFTQRSPMWVPATISFQGQEWNHVGVRYKGASSLSPWLLLDLHLPFKFDFDQFEDDYPEIDNQRFFGFKQLSLANNHLDPAGMRDIIVYDLLAEAGLPSLRTAPYEVVLDFGEGPVRLGLYTMIEVVDDTGVPAYFGSDDGNLYEGSGPGSSLSNQIPELVESDFEKKNNEKKEDWSDIWALYDALHAEQRTSDRAAWRADLEAVFDVDGFLEWLGLAAAVGHGDTYGFAPHNFYLYNDPATGQLTWVSWDHNITFRDDMRPFQTFDKAGITDAWPLIRYLLDDPVYWARYLELLARNYATVLEPDAVIEKIRGHAEVIAPVATLDMSQEEYDAAVQELVDFVEARAEEARRFLEEQGVEVTAAMTDDEEAVADGEETRPPGWTEATHSNDVDPNYDVVFPIDAVNTLTITIAPDDWAEMEADMEDIYAPSAYIRKGILAAGPDLTEEAREKLFLELVAAGASERAANAAAARATEQITGTEVLSGTGDAPVLREQMVSNRSPMWVPATISFQGRDWMHVGVRYKGASSLSPWVMGEMRLPFKFDFDQFEDDYPEIDNQRFFGFKQLSLANNYEDPAGLRDSVVYELLAEAGLPSLRTAPYELVLDYGEGPVRLGLYTVVEVVDDTGVASYFGSDDGNIYEGEGWGVALAPQDSHLVEDSFEKKNNEDKEDWRDIWAVYNALNAETRTSDPDAWRAGLEAVFDVDGFLEWLGLSAFLAHADTYGFAYHNFYLYNDPATGKLTWFSWDHNLTMREDLRAATTLDKANVTDAWPLIRFLLDDPVYWDRYVGLLAENFATVLEPDALIERIRTHAGVIAPTATLDMSQEEYDAAVQEVIDYVMLRAAETAEFLAGQE